MDGENGDKFVDRRAGPSRRVSRKRGRTARGESMTALRKARLVIPFFWILRCLLQYNTATAAAAAAAASTEMEVCVESHGGAAEEGCGEAQTCGGRGDKHCRFAESEGSSPSPEGATAKGVPVIDIGAVVRPGGHSAEAFAEAVEAIGKACREWGFFQAINHGVDTALVDAMREESAKFFALPLEDKLSCCRRTANNSRGFYDDELTKQTRDWKQGFDFGHVIDRSLPPDDPVNVVMDGFNQWPTHSPSFRDAALSYYDAMGGLSALLMEAVALSLGADAGFFEPFFSPHTSYLRLNYYPLCPDPDSHLSVNRHTDAGALTVLLQDDGVTALQVRRQRTKSEASGKEEEEEEEEEEEWVSISPVKGAFTINVGDMLQVWSNDLYAAPEHRVLSSAIHTRLSMPFFYNPSYHATVEPLTSTRQPLSSVQEATSPHAVRRYDPINFGAFRRRRFEGDFADVGTEVQISQFYNSAGAAAAAAAAVGDTGAAAVGGTGAGGR